MVDGVDYFMGIYVWWMLGDGVIVGFFKVGVYDVRDEEYWNDVWFVENVFVLFVVGWC